MNVLAIDTDGVGLDFCYRCAEAGHKVKWFLRPAKPGEKAKDGRGFPGIERVDDWRPWMKWAKEGLVWVAHNAMYLNDLDRWREFGFPVFAPSYRSAQLEINRGEGMRVLEQCGVPVPAYKTFKTLEEAEKFAYQASEAYVFKTLGDEEDKSLSTVSDSPADMVETIRQWRAKGLKLKGPCMLQEKVDGIEMGVSGWMGPQGFLDAKWNHNFEYKRLMPGDYGPNTGEQGTVIQYAKRSKLADEVLKPLEQYLLGLGHRGDLDVNCIIDKAGKPWVLEFTCRPGWPHHQIVQATHGKDPALWMRELLEGRDALEVSYDVAVGIVLTQPPYPEPSKDLARVEGLPIYGCEDVWDHIHPWQMMWAKGCDMDGDKIVEREIPKTTGDYIMVVSATGKKVSQARERCYEAAGSIRVKNLQLRNDVGADLEEKLPRLHKLGYCPELEF